MKSDITLVVALVFISLGPERILNGCSASQKAVEQKILNAADVVCAIDALDPGLAPAEIDAVIQKACGASADVHKIVDAQSRSLARHRMALATPLPPSCPSAAPPIVPVYPSASAATSAAPPAASSSAPKPKKK